MTSIKRIFPLINTGQSSKKKFWEAEVIHFSFYQISQFYWKGNSRRCLWFDVLLKEFKTWVKNLLFKAFPFQYCKKTGYVCQCVYICLYIWDERENWRSNFLLEQFILICHFMESKQLVTSYSFFFVLIIKVLFKILSWQDR